MQSTVARTLDGRNECMDSLRRSHFSIDIYVCMEEEQHFLMFHLGGVYKYLERMPYGWSRGAVCFGIGIAGSMKSLKPLPYFTNLVLPWVGPGSTSVHRSWTQKLDQNEHVMFKEG